MELDRSLMQGWRSLGETKGNYRNIDKAGKIQLGCFVTPTTCC
jgi:hypothetical protein